MDINTIYEKYDKLMEDETEHDCEATLSGYIWKITASFLLRKALEEFNTLKNK